ncbi:MAG: tetratricopeptide repeat protein [Betaproteobacteria bacterium]
MSIINKMLQDLDRRQGASEPAATLVQQVRSVPSPRKDREWFWRIMAVLLIVALGWVAWIAWQLQPREPVATAEAFKAAQNVSRKPPAPVAPAPAPPQVAAAPVPVPAAPAPTETKAPAPEQAVQKPAAIPAPAVEKPASKKAAPAAKAVKPVTPAATLGLDVPPARVLQAPAQAMGRVEKRDRVRSADDRAESEFRRGAAMLNEGRVIEAEEAFAAAIALFPAHESARQALVALHLEQGRIDEARRLLQDGVTLNPGNARFATVLARIHIERRDFSAALAVIDGVRAPEQGGAEIQSLRGTVLQQLGRHAEAVSAYQNALVGAPQSGAVWIGLAISLESVGRKPDAADAFRRAAATGTLNTEARLYAEQRARQLR